MDIMSYFPTVLGLFHNAATCSTTSSAIGCNAFWIIFYCIAMLVAYGAFVYALRYTYEQDAIKNNYNRKTLRQHSPKNTQPIQTAKSKSASSLDDLSNIELADRISKALYQI